MFLFIFLFSLVKCVNKIQLSFGFVFSNQLFLSYRKYLVKLYNVNVCVISYKVSRINLIKLRGSGCIIILKYAFIFV